MKSMKWIFILLIVPIVCGNVFAVSPYATMIQQNIQKKSFLTPASFPTTAADAPFIARMESKRDAYMPYFNRSAFADLPLDEQDEVERMLYQAEVNRINALNNSPLPVYCATYTDDADHCPQNLTQTTPVTNVPESIYDNLTPPDTPQTTTQPSITPYMSMSLTPANVARYGLKTHNGGCTPPERSDWWRNNIQTTGRYEKTDHAFEKFMITAFRKEGDCGQIPGDPGGYTCFGCASRGLCTGIDMKDITRGKVEDLAYKNMYRAYHVDRLPDAFRGYAMWGIWGSGPKLGIKLFQSALNAPKTGKIDDATIAAAENYRGDFAAVYTYAQEQLYRNIAAKNAAYQQHGVLNGWLKTLPLLQSSGCHVIPQNPIYR